MTGTAMDMDQLIRDAIERDGPTRAPAGLAAAVVARTEPIRQRRPLVPVLDREAWPARGGTVADPGTWRVLRVGVALVLVAAMLSAAAFIGARLTERTPGLDYAGTLTTIGTLSTPYEWPIAVPFDDRRVLVTGFPSSAGALLGEIIDVGTGVTAAVPWPNPLMWIEGAVRLDDGRVAVLAWVPFGSGPTGRSMLVVVDADRTAMEVDASLQPRLGSAMTLLDDGRLLLAGGVESQEATEALGSAEIVDLKTGAVTPVGSLGTPRAGATLTNLDDGRVLLSGGSDLGRESLGPGEFGEEVSNAVLALEVYDPTSARFEAFGALPSVPTSRHVVGLADGRILVFGDQDEQLCGRHGIDSIHTFIVDPRSGDVVEGPRAPHAVMAATALQDGTVLLAGHWQVMGPAPGGCWNGDGGSSGEYIEHPWIGTLHPLTGATRLSYDPFTGEATLEGVPSVPFGAATTMPDGRAVLVTWNTGSDGESAPSHSEVVVFD